MGGKNGIVLPTLPAMRYTDFFEKQQHFRSTHRMDMIVSYACPSHKRVEPNNNNTNENKHTVFFPEIPKFSYFFKCKNILNKNNTWSMIQLATLPDSPWKLRTIQLEAANVEWTRRPMCSWRAAGRARSWVCKKKREKRIMWFKQKQMSDYGWFMVMIGDCWMMNGD